MNDEGMEMFVMSMTILYLAILLLMCFKLPWSDG